MKSVIKSAKTIEEAIELGKKELGLSVDEIEYEILEEPTKGLFGLFGGNDAIVKVKEKKQMKIDVSELLDMDLNFDSKTELNKEEFKLDEKIEKKFEDLDLDFEEDLEEEQSEEFIEENNEDNLLEIDIETEDYEEDYYEQNPEESIENSEDIKVISEKTKKDLEEILQKMHIVADVEIEVADDKFIRYNLINISENDTGIIIGSKGETLNAIQYVLSLIANKYTDRYYRVTLNVADYRNRRKTYIEENAKKVAFKVLKTKKSIALKPMNSYERRIVHYALQNYKEIETVSTGKFPQRKVVVKYKG